MMHMKKSSSAQTHSLSSDSWTARRASAQKSFPTLNEPTFAYGLDISTHPGAFDFDAISRAAEQDDVFSLHETLPSGVVRCDLITAQKLFPFVEKKLGTLLSPENKLESFHLSRVKNVLVVVIPPNTNVEEPLPILPHSNVFEHVFVWAQKNSSVSLTHIEKDPPSIHHTFRSTAVEIFAEDHSRVSYTSIQSFSSACQRIAFKRAHVSAHASVDWHWAEFGSLFSKVDVSSHLIGERASTKNLGIYLENGTQVMDIDANVYHSAPHTRSELLARGVLDDSSKNAYKGLIKMSHVASGSVGNQRADILVLSPLAEADPVPMLEIEGSDIRCSHAATISRLDAAKLFYLASRGLDESTSRSLVISGFLDYLLARFPSLNIVDESRSLIRLKLGLSPREESFLHSPAEVLA
jgi:Fe-S cluster assembly scaffold protein SufB